MTGGERSRDGFKQPRYDGDLQGRTLRVERIFPNVKCLCVEVHELDLQRVEERGSDPVQTSNMEPFCFPGDSANRAASPSTLCS